MVARRRAAPTAPEVTAAEATRGLYTALGYRSVRVANREGRVGSEASGRRHEQYDRRTLQVQAREFRRDNGIFAGMIRRARSYIIGTGYRLQCLSGSTRWNAKAEAAWADWWRSPEVSGLLSGVRLEQLLCDEVLTVGDAGVVLSTGGKLQLVEAEQIRGPGDMDPGVTFKGDVVSGYWVCPYGTTTFVPDLGRKRLYKPSEFLYVGALERPSSIRAMPPCQSEFSMLHRINDVLDAEAIARQLEARIALIVNRTSGLPVPAAVAAEDSSLSNPAVSGSNPAGTWVTELDYATIVHGSIGDQISGMERVAGKALAETLTPFFRVLGMPLGLPLEITTLDWTKSNYSQSRAVLEQAHVAFLEWQGLLEDSFYRPVFSWWLQRQIDARTIPARADAFDHEWIKPSPPWIDLLAESQAAGERLDRGLATYATVCKSQNLDPDVVRESRAVEIEWAIERAKQVQTATGVLPDWRTLIGQKAAPAPAAAPTPTAGGPEPEAETSPPPEGEEVPAVEPETEPEEVPA